jgi:hypothetical protein
MNVARDRKTIVLAGITVLFALLAALWTVSRYSHITPIKNFDSLSVVLERTNCFGTCPVYTIAINGNGLVEYSGRQFVRVHGSQTASIDRNTLDDLLRSFDRTHFLAFTSSFQQDCTDMPGVIVTITADGRSKRVESDELCPEHGDFLKSVYRRFSRQEDFLTLAREIDSVTASDRWVKCDGRCRN